MTSRKEATRRQSRSRGPPPPHGGGFWGGGSQAGDGGGKCWGGDHHHRHGVTAVAEAEEVRLGLVVARYATKEANLDRTTGAVAPALGEATVGGGTAREAV